MFKVIFIYNGKDNMIQCNKNDKMKSIFQKYVNKIEKDINSIYFLYGGNNINDGELTLEQTANNLDKKNNEIKIIVNDIDSSSSNKNLKDQKILFVQNVWKVLKLK